MKVLLVTPELAPYSQCSGLAEVAAALPKALRGLNHQVTVLSPLYGGIDPSQHALARRLSTIDVSLGGETLACAVFDGRTTGGVDLLFVAHERFGEGPVAEDSAEARTRALLFGQAAAELARTREPLCDIVHAFGFQSALALPLAAARMDKIGTVLSLFDPTQQGVFEPGELAADGLPEAVTHSLSQTPPNLLASGIRAAQRILTNSPSLANALLAGDVAPALCEALQERRDAVQGLAEGVDAALWNPLTDPQLTARFDPADASGKDECKGALQYELGLPIRPDTPLLAVYGTVNAEEIPPTITALLRNDVQVALALRGKLPSSLSDLLESHDEQVKAIDVGDDGSLHRLFGGADFLWSVSGPHPATSLHLAAQRYGTLAVVPRAGVTGETVVDCDAQLETGTGFLYDPDPESLLSALQRALAAYAQTDAFETLRKRAMRTDTSWDRAARRCEHIYRTITE